MRYSVILFFVLLLGSCGDKVGSHKFSEVEVEIIYEDSLSIRAIELLDGSLAFAANKGVFGAVDLKTHQVQTNKISHDSLLPQFRAVAHTSTDFFMLSVANPALLYKTGDSGEMELVYQEKDSLVFYDSMRFWSDSEGIAVGDAMNGCMSIIITRDGGKQWSKLSCELLPQADEGEGAFAASNTNIAIVGDNTWIATTSGRILFSPDKGREWQLIQTPVINEKPTQGIYSIDFWDEELGFAIGGDYTSPENMKANKAITFDGGQSWQLVADGAPPAYKSCVQFVPGGGGQDLVAIGFTGISYSSDQGLSWEKLSDESFYTLRFLNDSVAYAAGRNRIARLVFK